MTETPQAIEDALTRIAEDGYVILKDVLSADDLDRLRAELLPHERDKPMGRNSFEGEKSQRVYSLVAKGPAFEALAAHPAIVALLDRLMMPNWLLSTMQSIRLYPGETEQPWHTDDMFYPVPRPHPILAVSAIWAIEDFTEENGATELVPRSHLWGKEHPDDRATEIVPAAMPAGSVLVFDGALWHRGGSNRSRGTRLCISPQYCQAWLRPQESQLLIAPPAIAERFSPRLRSMVGYNIHPPFVGQVDGMHPMRLIDPTYRSGQREHRTEASILADQFLERPKF